MRLALLAGWLSALYAVRTFAAPPAQDRGTAVLGEDIVTGKTLAQDGKSVEYSIFNGVKVPPMIDIGDKFAETVKDGYW